MIVSRFTQLRTWQACDEYKRAIYSLCRDGALARDFSRRDQLEKSVAGPPAHIAEGFGRFNPPDFARFAVMARASLMESQNHLLDAVQKGYIADDVRLEYDKLATVALAEVTGLITYLQSPGALENARRAKEKAVARRRERRG